MERMMSNEHEVSRKKVILMRQFRRAVVLGLPLIGVQIIISVILFSQAHLRLAIVMLGFLLVELSVLMLVNKVVPNERRYLALRSETDHFLKLVRQLNTAAIRMYRTDIPDYRKEFDNIQASMVQSVQRMGAVAGKTDEDLAEEQQEVQAKTAQNDS
jgi:hypothetical protein